MEDPIGVVPAGGSPRRKRRPSRRSGIGHKNTGALRRPRHPSMQKLARATSDMTKAKTRTLEGGDGKRVGAEMGKGGACRPAPFGARPTGAGSECARGRHQVTAPWPNPIRQCASSAPLIFERAPDHHPKGPRPQAWFAQRKEQVAARQRPNMLLCPDHPKGTEL